MTNETCPDLEVLFAEAAEGQGPAVEHARTCPACSVLMEDHRQLEKDLYRLADPLPPPDFVQQVMAKVAKAPVPVTAELKTGLAILLVALAVPVVLWLSQGGTLAGLGAAVADAVVGTRPYLAALASALGALWSTAAVPVAVSLALILTLSLVGLKRLAGNPSNSSDLEVSP
ncbi:MAG TPA: hypothetical protein VK420_06235 [Longimicrobium sp.]|nr:hypothetical protein [Longimicrobium sp.]